MDVGVTNLLLLKKWQLSIIELAPAQVCEIFSSSRLDFEINEEEVIHKFLLRLSYLKTADKNFRNIELHVKELPAIYRFFCYWDWLFWYQVFSRSSIQAAN